uniref:Uncharacterized protein n=1 Tax=Oryza meridionalis TaxID=40149 RepID=A0A0E0FA42_9ORYZ
MAVSSTVSFVFFTISQHMDLVSAAMSACGAARRDAARSKNEAYEMRRINGGGELTVPDLDVLRCLPVDRRGGPDEEAAGAEEAVDLEEELAAPDVPWHAAARAVDGVVGAAGEGEALGAHDGGDGRDAALQRELHLRLVLVLGRQRHGERVAVEQEAAEAGHAAADVEHDAAAPPPRHRRDRFLDQVDVVRRAVYELRPAAGERQVLAGDLHPVLVPLVRRQLGVRHVVVPDLVAAVRPRDRPPVAAGERDEARRRRGGAVSLTVLVVLGRLELLDRRLVVQARDVVLAGAHSFHSCAAAAAAAAAVSLPLLLFLFLSRAFFSALDSDACVGNEPFCATADAVSFSSSAWPLGRSSCSAAGLIFSAAVLFAAASSSVVWEAVPLLLSTAASVVVVVVVFESSFMSLIVWLFDGAPVAVSSSVVCTSPPPSSSPLVGTCSELFSVALPSSVTGSTPSIFPFSSSKDVWFFDGVPPSPLAFASVGASSELLSALVSVDASSAFSPASLVSLGFSAVLWSVFLFPFVSVDGVSSASPLAWSPVYLPSVGCLSGSSGLTTSPPSVLPFSSENVWFFDVVVSPSATLSPPAGLTDSPTPVPPVVVLATASVAVCVSTPSPSPPPFTPVSPTSSVVFAVSPASWTFLPTSSAASSVVRGVSPPSPPPPRPLTPSVTSMNDASSSLTAGGGLSSGDTVIGTFPVDDIIHAPTRQSATNRTMVAVEQDDGEERRPPPPPPPLPSSRWYRSRSNNGIL